MHEHYIEDASGDLVEVVALCSDSCHQAYAGEAYGGWNGSHETEPTTWCAQCGVVLPGTDPDDNDACVHTQHNLIVNRFRSLDGERCSHGNWIQLPAERLHRQ